MGSPIKSYKDDDIAVIGMSGLFPEAESLDVFWDNLVSGMDSIREFPTSRKNELKDVIPDVYQRDFMKVGYVDQIAQFEPEIFSISQEESRFIDPQQRLLIQLVEEAILHAGYAPDQLADQLVGLYFASNLNSYTDQIASDSPMKFLNSIPSMMAGRIAYTYNFNGPALTFDTACSSSLTAFHYAVQSLRSGDADIAITGGTSLVILPEQKKDIEKQSVLSVEQKVRTFDKHADGTVAGEGGGVLILKRLKNALEDRDPIHAIVKGSSLNSNGNRANGLAAPSERGQAEVILRGIKNAQIDPLSLSYIETHGTGTKIGDPIEVMALTKALNELGYPRQSVAIGSLKSNIGHLDSAAGIASVIKAILSLKHEQIPASINFESPNPLIDFVDSPVYVNDIHADWQADTVRRVGVTSLGMIGTNVFSILEQPPVTKEEVGAAHSNVVLLSARTYESLQGVAHRLLVHLERNQAMPLDDIAYTLNTGRRKFPTRLSIAADSTEELIHALQDFIAKDKEQIVAASIEQQSHSSILMIADLEHTDLHSIEQMTDKHPQFKRWVDECQNQIVNEEDQQNAKLMYLTYMYAYAKLITAYSIPIKAVLGIGMGELVADLIMKKKTFEETVDRIKNYNEPEKVIEDAKLKALGQQIVKSGIHTFITLCFKPELIAQFKRAIEPLPSTTLLTFTLQSRSFTDAISSLIQNGLEIDWTKVYEGEKRWRVSLPGYAYTTQSYFIKPGELVSSVLGGSSVVPEIAEIMNDLPIQENVQLMFREVYTGSTYTLTDQTGELQIDSIMVMQFAGKVKKGYGVDVPLSLFFENKPLGDVFDIIESLIDSRSSHVNDISKQPEKEYYPASPPQKRIFILNQLVDDNISYNMPGAMTITGKLDRAAFQHAFQALIERHESLRTTFELVDDRLIQRIHPKLELEIEYVAKADIQHVIAEFVKPFRLDQLPLLRVTLVKLKAEKHLFLFDIHHIVSDGLSMGILIEELIHLYEGLELQPLTIQYRDFTVWQAEWFETDSFKQQEQYWLDKLSGELPVLALPTDYPRPAIQSFEGSNFEFETNQSLTEKVFKVTAQEDITLNMLLLTAYNVLLYKYTGQEDIIVGSPIAGRRHADLEGIIGMFVNTLAMRNHPQGTKTFRTFLDEVKETAIDAIDNQDYQFEDLIEKLDVRRDQSRNPLFDTMFVLQNMHSGDADTGSLKFEPYLLGSKVSKFDLNMTASNDEEKIHFSLEYCTKLFKEETIIRLSQHYLNILEQVVHNLHLKLDAIDMLSSDEKSTLLHRFNETEMDYEHRKTIHELFTEQVNQAPDQIALVFENTQLTYRELHEKSNHLAIELRRRGVGRDQVVGLLVDRSLEMIIGLMGILKAGAAYLPIDPKYPAERIEYMLEDSRARLLITQGDLISDIQFHGETFDIRQLEECFEGTDLLLNTSTPSDVAYILYTSGSTGKPKGVMIEHKAVNNFIHGITQAIDFATNKTVLCLTTISFDIFVLETLLPLTRGLKVVIANEKEQVDPKLLGQVIVNNRVEMLQTTPSRLQLLVSDSTGIEALQHLNVVMVGGEPFPETLLNMLKRLLGLRIYNMYGPTETTVWSAVKELTNEDQISIGQPISNTRFYILDKNNQLQPVGIPGELCIAGESLARGYWNQPELTAEKFVPNPFEADTRMYRTGDMARWLADGNVDFIGRADNQVKIRGYRIEPSEIESYMLQYEPIKEAIVLAREDASGTKYLGAYYTASEDVTAASIRSYLSQSLPDYMIPSFFMQLVQMPLTPNGKLDRKQLPMFDGQLSTTTEYAPPRNKTEEKLVQIWQELLGIEQVGVNDNFFELGGHSLKAALFIARVNKEFGFHIQLREIFQQPTIRHIAVILETRIGDSQLSIAAVEARTYYPVPQAVQEVLRHSLSRETNTLYNKTLITLIKGPLDRAQLEKSLASLIQRHGILRTSFEIVDGVYVQKVHEEVQFSIIDLIPADIEAMIHTFVRPFQTDQAPLIRVGLAELAPESFVLMLDMHQTMTDGTSGNILIREMMALYANLELEPLSIQYKDYSVWLAEQTVSENRKKQEQYWLDVFADQVPVLDFPTDFARQEIQQLEGHRFKFDLDKKLVNQVKQFSTSAGVTLFMTLFAGYNMLMYKYTNKEDVVVGTSVACRPHSELQKVIGSFTNSLAMRNYPKSELSVMEFLQNVKENTLAAFEHQDYRYADLVDKLGLRDDLSGNPLYRTMFVLHNMEISEAKMGDMTFTPYEQETCYTKYDFIWHAHESQDEIKIDLMYSSTLFKQETIHQLADDFIFLLSMMTQHPSAKLKEIISTAATV
ncbi:amino acid adenylation domain-containing protein [Paenibacillus sp. SC116]|uniref:non-ribosomal peptide synthetase n=1 Tax=Paenibacillus sp. SC116 TaxID=2968986 RepID=UPI00215A3961|nr:non-ribosomal peptide synthetase [Paenibacillus sp. SC116]MCR8842476.1 amino acid adenylation domain-containing protein [Paenibacillus sp. SC116]